MNDSEALLLLSCVVEPGNARVNRILQDYSPSELIARSDLIRRDTHGHLKDASLQTIEQQAKRCQARFITRLDAAWPSALNDLGLLTPLGIWIRGRDIDNHNISIVGARSCTLYGQDVAMSIAGDVAMQGFTVVSGGAFGIDAAAHRGALAVSGPTVAVLAGGIDQFYPQAHSALFESIVESGALISESPPKTPPLRHRFLIRNRLIAALGRVSVVVEARHRSGAIATASHAAAIGRDVAAVPGCITSASSSGCHALIRDGAILVTSADEIIELASLHTSQTLM